MMYFKYKSNELYFSIILILISLLLSCGNGVDSKSPQEPSYPIPVQDTKSLIDIDSIPTSNDSSDLKTPDWENAKNYYSSNPEFTMDVEYSVFSSQGISKHQLPFKLKFSEVNVVKLGTLPSPLKHDEKIISKDEYSVLIQLIQLLLDNPELFPQTLDTITINSQTYETITLSKVPAYMILILMEAFYFIDFEQQLTSPLQHGYPIDKSTPLNEYVVSSQILSDAFTIESAISYSTANLRVIKRAKFYESYKNALASTLISNDHNGSVDERYRRYARSTLENLRFHEINELVDTFSNHKKLPLLRALNYLVETKNESSDSPSKKQYSSSVLYTMENDLFDTSVTIIKDNYIPIDLSIESKLKGVYTPILKLSLAH